MVENQKSKIQNSMIELLVSIGCRNCITTSFFPILKLLPTSTLLDKSRPILTLWDPHKTNALESFLLTPLLSNHPLQDHHVTPPR